MIQLKILSGKMAGTETVARRFPFKIGRSASADLRLGEGGVWDQHLELAFVAATGFVLTTHPDALAAINCHAIREAVLRNADELAIGALRMRFLLERTTSVKLK